MPTQQEIEYAIEENILACRKKNFAIFQYALIDGHHAFIACQTDAQMTQWSEIITTRLSDYKHQVEIGLEKDISSHPDQIILRSEDLKPY